MKIRTLIILLSICGLLFGVKSYSKQDGDEWNGVDTQAIASDIENAENNISSIEDSLTIVSNKSIWDVNATLPITTTGLQSIITLTIYDADTNKDYFVKYFGRNPTTNRHWFVVDYTGSGLDYNGVCGFYNSTGYDESTLGTTQKIVLQERNNSGITADLIINWGKLNDGGLTLNNADFIEAGLSKNIFGFIKNPLVVEDTSIGNLYHSPLDSNSLFDKKATFEGVIAIKNCLVDIEIKGAEANDKFFIYYIGRNAGVQDRRYVWIGKNETKLYIGGTIDGEDPTGIIEYNYTIGSITVRIVIDWDLVPDTIVFEGSITKTILSNRVIELDVDRDIRVVDQRLLVPTDLYFLGSEKLPIYKRNILGTIDYENYVKTGFASLDGDVPFSELIYEALRVDPVELLGDNLRIFSQYLDKDGNVSLTNLYYKNITKHHVDASHPSGKSADVIMFGDSITDYDIAPITGGRLTDLSASVAWKGTFLDDGYLNEGRASWEYKQLIGMKTIAYNGSPIAPGLGSLLTKNPFLKIATITDKTNHPTWCFENNAEYGNNLGKETELNYTESQAIGTYTGEYYIFDFTWYLTNTSQTIAAGNPFIAIQGLGYNDIHHNTGDISSVDTCLLAMEIFVRQMYAYRNDTVIGIAPILTSFGTTYWNTVASWIERSIQLVATLKAEGIDVYIVPTYMSVDRMNAYAWTGVGLSSDNDSQKGTVVDASHPTTFGKTQISNTMVYFIANQL